MKLFEDDVIHRHPVSAILTGVEGNPLVGVFRYLAKVRGQHDHLGAVVT